MKENSVEFFAEHINFKRTLAKMCTKYNHLLGTKICRVGDHVNVSETWILLKACMHCLGKYN